MMTLLMIDVEAGKEDLWDRLHENYDRQKYSYLLEKIKMLYMSRCYTHADLSILLDVVDFEALPMFLLKFILSMDGAFDIRILQLFDPKCFALPEHVDLDTYQRFSVTLDVKSEKTTEIFNKLRDLAATDEAAISFLAYTFHSYDEDLVLTFLAPNVEDAGRFITEKIRSIDGVLDSIMWQIEKWQFFCSMDEWKEYINHYRTGDHGKDDFWNDVFICAC